MTATAASRDATAPRAGSTRRRLKPYGVLSVATMAINATAVAVGSVRNWWHLDDGSAVATSSALALVNLAVAVVVRHQRLLDTVYQLVGRASPDGPWWVRRLLSHMDHVCGIHVGAAVSGTAWLAVFTVCVLVARVRYPDSVTTTTLLLAVGLLLILSIVSLCSAPVVRMRAHNLFEATHRWGGWTALGIFWWLTVHLATQEHPSAPVLSAVAAEWRAWVLATTTASIAWPWLRLRRVPVYVETPSAHAAIVHLGGNVRPCHPSAIGISRAPLREWHAFATITSPGRSGCRIVVSRAGDWTSRFIDDPPTHVWVRGIPVVAPMAMAARLYNRVAYVVTGSGIGPMLGQLLADEVPGRLVWSTREPRRTYGNQLVDEVLAAQPHATIWNTTERGKPDLTHLALEAVAEFDADAVFIVSNRATTLATVEALQARGIPAYGPIWDS